MPHFDEKPTLESITSLRVHLMDVWGDTWGDWEERDSYYFQSFELWPPQMTGRSVYHPGRSRQIVDSAVDHQMGFKPHIHRFPSGEGDQHKERSTRVEDYLFASFEEAALQEPVLTWKAVAKNLIHLGYAVTEGPILNWRDRPKEPKRKPGESEEDYQGQLVLWENEKKTWMPFQIKAPHPARVLLDPTIKTPYFAVKHAAFYSHQLSSMTISRRARPRDVDQWEVGEDPFRLVMCDIYWAKGWHAVVANTDVSGVSGNGSRGGGRMQPAARAIIVERNSWGFVPYDHAFCGWGQIPTDEKENNPKYLATGILSPIMGSLKLQAQAVSGRHNALMEATYNPTGTTMDTSELAAQLARSDILQLPDKSAVWKMEIPNMPAWTFEAERWLDEDIELATMSRTLAGVKEPGVVTVGQQLYLASAAAKKFIAANKQLEYLATGMATRTLRMVDVLGETLYCRGKTIRPSDIEHDYSVQVTFEVVDPDLQLRLRELGMREVKERLLSREMYWLEAAKREDGSAEEKRILRDEVYQHPAVHEYMAAQAAKELGLEGIIEDWNARQTQAAGGPTGVAATQAGGAANPPKPTGLLGPDGLPVMGGSMGQAPLDSPSTPANRLNAALTDNTPTGVAATGVAARPGRNGQR